MKCVRCQSELPDGSGYCVGCGHSNVMAAEEKKVKIDSEIDRRLTAAKFFQSISNLFFWGRKI